MSSNCSRSRDFNLILLGYTAYTFAMGAFAAWGPTFLNRVHDLELGKAGLFFGEVLVVAGLVGTLAGGFAATAWQRRNRAGYAWLLTLSVVATVPFATVAFLHVSTTTSMACLGTAMLLLVPADRPHQHLIVESVPVALRASAMAASIFAIHLFGDFWSPDHRRTVVGLVAAAGSRRRDCIPVLVLRGPCSIFCGARAGLPARGGHGTPG